MKKILSLLCLIISVSVFSAESGVDINSDIIGDLNKLEAIYSKWVKAQDKKDADQLMKEIIKKVRERERRKAGMSDMSFIVLSDMTKNEFMDENKTKNIETALINSKITCGQLTTLLKMYSFDDGKKECIEKIYDKIADKENIIILFKAIESDITKDELREIIGH